MNAKKLYFQSCLFMNTFIIGPDETEADFNFTQCINLTHLTRVEILYSQKTNFGF